MTSPAHTSPMELTLKSNTDLEVCQVLYLETLSALLESVPLNGSLLKLLMNLDFLSWLPDLMVSLEWASLRLLSMELPQFSTP